MMEVVRTPATENADSFAVMQDDMKVQRIRKGDILLLRTFDEARDRLMSGHFYAVRIHGRQRIELFKAEVNEHGMLKLYTDEEPGASYFDNMGKDKVDIIGEVIGFQVLIDYNELDDRRAQGN